MKLQPPKGTRDFYPREMAWRNHLIDAWRRVSIRNGFEQVDGPIFESLDLYKVKSGEGIVSELFHFQDRGERELAIRPEFTPTLARMVAAQANALPKPIKWFCTPNLCRAERPQRGRLREFWQWNVDILGAPAPLSTSSGQAGPGSSEGGSGDARGLALADAECIFTAIDLLAELKLRPEHVRVKISHRKTARDILAKMGVPDDQMNQAFDLLDRREKLPPEEFAKAAAALGLDEARVARFEQICRMKYPIGGLSRLSDHTGLADLSDLAELDAQIRGFGIAEWCEYDLGIVRGLAYYTGTVFEIHEVSGAMRAMAGGGRYDQLIELFGGPPTPAVGFGMGDVVLSDVLADKGLMPEEVGPRPDVYAIALTDAAGARLPGVVAALRRQGIHARMSYKSGRNVGKLLKDATTARARFALILDDKISGNVGSLKDLTSGDQTEVPLDEVAKRVGA